MYAPAEHDEITTTVNYADKQLEAIRAAVHGLTEEQAHETPCRSTLSIAVLLRHTTFVMEGTMGRIADGPRTGDPTPEEFAAFSNSFVVADDEPATGILARFDEVRPAYLDALRGVDPDAETVEPSAPWDGFTEASPVRWRYVLGHQIEELARHAGHADIIREQIDGQLVPNLVATLAGRPANAYFTPFEAPPGSITA